MNADLVKTGRVRRSPQGQGTLYPLPASVKSVQQKPVFRVLEDSATSDALVTNSEQVMAKEKCKSENEQYQVFCKVANLSAVSSPLPPRFLVKIEFLSNGCWQWLGAKRYPIGPSWRGKKSPSHYCYGLFSSNGKSSALVSAHRYSYQIHNGLIPQGLEIDHLCSNKLCVNPSHLEAVTHRENVIRSYRRGR